MSLADKACVPCRGGVPPLTPERVEQLLGELQPGWRVDPEGHLERDYKFKDFAQALEFVNRVAAIAEAEGHHPDLHLSWGKCRAEIWTHKIQGLTESDFYFAAKTDRTYEPFASMAR
jgi:4a-hydroxytetrahydrobiopterin dehydratase